MQTSMSGAKLPAGRKAPSGAPSISVSQSRASRSVVSSAGGMGKKKQASEEDYPSLQLADPKTGELKEMAPYRLNRSAPPPPPALVEGKGSDARSMADRSETRSVYRAPSIASRSKGARSVRAQSSHEMDQISYSVSFSGLESDESGDNESVASSRLEEDEEADRADREDVDRAPEAEKPEIHREWAYDDDQPPKGADTDQAVSLIFEESETHTLLDLPQHAHAPSAHSPLSSRCPGFSPRGGAGRWHGWTQTCVAQDSPLYIKVLESNDRYKKKLKQNQQQKDTLAAKSVITLGPDPTHFGNQAIRHQKRLVPCSFPTPRPTAPPPHRPTARTPRDALTRAGMRTCGSQSTESEVAVPIVFAEEPKPKAEGPAPETAGPPKLNLGDINKSALGHPSATAAPRAGRDGWPGGPSAQPATERIAELRRLMEATPTSSPRASTRPRSWPSSITASITASTNAPVTPCPHRHRPPPAKAGLEALRQRAAAASQQQADKGTDTMAAPGVMPTGAPDQAMRLLPNQRVHPVQVNLWDIWDASGMRAAAEGRARGRGAGAQGDEDPRPAEDDQSEAPPPRPRPAHQLGPKRRCPPGECPSGPGGPLGTMGHDGHRDHHQRRHLAQAQEARLARENVLFVQNLFHEPIMQYRNLLPLPLPEPDARSPVLYRLWAYQCDLTAGLPVAAIAVNRHNPQPQVRCGPAAGADPVLVAEEPWAPQTVIRTPVGVTALAFSVAHPPIIAAGMYDGSIASTTSASATPSPSSRQAGLDRRRHGAGEPGLGLDRRQGVLWNAAKGFEHTDLMRLRRLTSTRPKLTAKLTPSSPAPPAALACPAAAAAPEGRPPVRPPGPRTATDAFISRVASGTCFDFQMHAAADHNMSPFCPEFFLSCSADWTARLWHSEHEETPLFTFQSFKDYVADVVWSPTHSSLFVTATGDGTLDVWDLAHSTVDPLIAGAPQDSPLGALAFGPDGTVLFAGDAQGAVHVYKLANIPPRTADALRQAVMAEGHTLLGGDEKAQQQQAQQAQRQQTPSEPPS
ncbi:putative THO complex subunit 2 [Paratrimastix pyriformis]|uniref:THO complex subunit 2 n=1 Tax=Paratrimastix pyriformis TaxID=342808 RepID=A0ABQ8US96_9EUKA|nr:putative THO complex subunit 2 [Paratrimastix pyriformis]